MIRILFITHSISLYGATRSLIDLASELQRLGHHLFFFIPQEGNLEERHKLTDILDKIRVTYTFLTYCPAVHRREEHSFWLRDFRKTTNKKCLKEMEEYVNSWRIDIIHTNSLTHLIGIQLSQRVHKPHVWHIREGLKKDFSLYYDNKLQYKCGLLKTKQIICISNYIQKIHRKMLLGTHVTTIYNGFNIDNYILEEAYHENPSIFTIMICGSIQESKGQFDAVKAIEILIKHREIKNIRLRIVGNCCNEYGREIKKYIEENHLESYIEMITFQLDLKKLRKEADIALMCSKSEGLGRVTVESMLSENVVIGASCAGTAEIIKDGVNGYLYESGNVYDLSEKIYNVITHWSEQQKIIKNAKEYAKLNFNIENYAEKICEIYFEILSVKKRKNKDV